MESGGGEEHLTVNGDGDILAANFLNIPRHGGQQLIDFGFTVNVHFSHKRFRLTAVSVNR